MLTIEIRRARRGLLRRNQWYAVIVASNGLEIWRTSETYNNHGDVAEIARHLITSVAKATVVDFNG